MNTKRCSLCRKQRIKDVDIFKNRHHADGYSYTCKFCVRDWKLKKSLLVGDQHIASECERVGLKMTNLFRRATVITNIGCWISNRKKKDFYSLMTVNGRLDTAHRTFYKYFKGPIPTGMMVCHKCDQKPCFNPEHLFLGTAKDNVHDMMMKGRMVRKKKTIKLDNEMPRIKRLIKKGYSQIKVAKIIGLSSSAISRRLLLGDK